jgi:enamine deaminase RidA (YjgF/YER057c/UK114 family)
MNGASDLNGELFGEKGLHARTAVGVVELPWGSPIEVELVVALNGG